MSDKRYSVPQLLNPILFDGNVTMYGFNRTVILTDEMQYYHKSNYTDEQVDFKYIIGMATMLARSLHLFKRRVVSGEVLAGAVIPGGCGREGTLT